VTIPWRWNGIEFVSDPLPKPTEVSGLFSGRLDFITNKNDFDFNIALYELTPKNDYVERGRQINYGTGRNVSDETIQDAKVPLEIKWYSDSYVDLPVWR